MATITTIDASDLITDSRSDINTNFANLNSDKIETSTLDTDTTLAANSNSKIATQAAVKSYVDAGGNVNASTTTKGIVEEATSAEMIAGTAAGATGARLFLNPSLVAETGNDKIVKTKSTGKLDASIIPGATIAAGTTTHDISSTTTKNIAHGLGSIPTMVRLTAVMASTNNRISYAYGVYTSAEYSVTLAGDIGTGTSETHGTGFILFANSAAYNQAAITLDSTNIILTWSKTGTPSGTISFVWEAYK